MRPGREGREGEEEGKVEISPYKKAWVIGRCPKKPEPEKDA